MQMTKKGAIELSMTTIIVIVIGVTLLILGLTWVRGLFEKVTALTDQAFRDAEKIINDQMGSTDKVYIAGSSFEIANGKYTVVYMGIQNFGEPGISNKFSAEVEGEHKDWFTIPDLGDIMVGEKKAVPFRIDVPRGTEPGKPFTFTIKVMKDDTLYSSNAILVNVK